jgi:type I restriction enzyme S subunit
MSELETLHFPIPENSVCSLWQVVPVGDILFDIQTGFASGRHNNDGVGIAHLRPMNINADGKIDLSDVRHVASDVNALRLRQGDILFNNTNSPVWVGKTALVETENELAFSNHMTRLRTCDGVDPRFVARQLHFVCRSGYFEHQCKKHVNQASINRDFLANHTPFLLPPAAEQVRIANKLDSLMSRVDSCRERLDRVPAILRRFRQSVLAAASSGKLTEEWREQRGVQFDWATTCIDDVATDIRYGTSKKCWYEPKVTPVIRIPNVVSGAISIDDLKYAEFDESDTATLSLQEDDILMIRSNGSVELVGRTAIVTNIAAGFLYAGYLIRIRIDQQKANAKFVNLCLSSPACRNIIEQIAKSTSGVNNINAQEIRKLEIPLPSVEEQNEIVRRVNELLTGADSFDARFDSSVQIAERLSLSILHKAFRGAIVPQDPNDEPASVLLERIREQRQTSSANKPKRSTKQSPHESKKKAAMTKSRFDDDVQGKPYLAGFLKGFKTSLSGEDLFKKADLPLVDFYKQLDFEVKQKMIVDRDGQLEAA